MDREKRTLLQQTTPCACEDLPPPFPDRTHRTQRNPITTRLTVSTPTQQAYRQGAHSRPLTAHYDRRASTLRAPRGYLRGGLAWSPPAHVERAILRYKIALPSLLVSLKEGAARLSFTGRIEGAHSDRAASASKKDGLAAPLPPSQAGAA